MKTQIWGIYYPKTGSSMPIGGSPRWLALDAIFGPGQWQVHRLEREEQLRDGDYILLGLAALTGELDKEYAGPIGTVGNALELCRQRKCVVLNLDGSW